MVILMNRGRLSVKQNETEKLSRPQFGEVPHFSGATKILMWKSEKYTFMAPEGGGDD